MRPIKPCRKAFNEAQAFRATVPLPKGRYKLEQAQWELRRFRSDIDSIIKIVRNGNAKTAKAALVCCAPAERAVFLKRIPRHIANILGRLILPAIAKLEADGVSRQQARTLLQDAKQRADDIIDNADHVHRLLKAGIKTEYDAMRAGDSHLRQLVDSAEDLVQTALALCPIGS